MNDETERARLADAIRVHELLCDHLHRAGAAMARLLDGDPDAMLATLARVKHREARRQRVNDARQLSGRAPLPTTAFADRDGGQTRAEAAAEWHADALDRTARRALELHRIGDGPGPAAFASACSRYAQALRLAAAGRWPDDLDAIHATMRESLATMATDTRTTARGALRVHELTVGHLREIGESIAASRVEFECRHEVAELRRIAEA